MLSYDYIPVNGHVVANIRGRNFLVDMGIPHSIASRPLLLEGKRLEANTEAFGLTINDFSRLVGISLDGVLGSHIGNEFVLNVLPGERNLILDHYLPDFPINIEVENLGGLPLMHQSIGHKRIRGLMNLGCALSLINEDLVAGYDPIGRRTELFGYIGEREVDVYSLPVMIDRQTIYLQFGVMPPEVAQWMELANVEAVLGAELLQHYSISMALEQSTVSLQPLH